MGSRVYPANRHCDWIRTRSCGRRWPIPTPIGAAFGDEPQGHSRRILLGRGCIPCAVRKNTRSHRTRKYFQRAHARGRESARLKNALRPPRVVFVIGCVSCNTFSHFRQKNGTETPNGRGHRRAKRRPPGFPPPMFVGIYATTPSPTELPDYLPYASPIFGNRRIPVLV